MTAETLMTFFGWCTVIGFGLLLFSSVMLVGMRGTILGIHSKMTDVSESELKVLYLKFLAHYKMAVIVFAFTPWLALKLMA